MIDSATQRSQSQARVTGRPGTQSKFVLDGKPQTLTLDGRVDEAVLGTSHGGDAPSITDIRRLLPFLGKGGELDVAAKRLFEGIDVWRAPANEAIIAVDLGALGKWNGTREVANVLHLVSSSAGVPQHLDVERLADKPDEVAVKLTTFPSGTTEVTQHEIMAHFRPEAGQLALLWENVTVQPA